MRNHAPCLMKRVCKFWTDLEVRYVIEVDGEETGYTFDIYHIENNNDERIRKELEEKASRISWEMLDYYSQNPKFKEIEFSFEQRIRIKP